MSDFSSAFPAFLAPGLTLTYHRLKSAFFLSQKGRSESSGAVRAAQTPPSNTWARGWCQTGLGGAVPNKAGHNTSGPHPPPAAPCQIAGTQGPHHRHQRRPRAHSGHPLARRQPPARSASGVASSATSPAQSRQTRYRVIVAQIVGSAMEPSRRSNFSGSFCTRIPTKPRLIHTSTVPTLVMGVLHALGIVRYLHNQNEIPILDRWPPPGSSRAMEKFSKSD